MSKRYDIGIIGFGIAGATLAHQCLQRSLRVCVITSPGRVAVSKGATGLISPIAGMRFGLLEHFEQWWNHAWEFYATYSAIEPIECYRLLYEADEVRWWEHKRAQLGEHNLACDGVLPWFLSMILVQPRCVVHINRAARVLATKVLDVLQSRLRAAGAFVEATIQPHEHMSITRDCVRIGDIECQYAVFCEGAWMAGNPLFAWIPRMFARGQRISGILEREGLPGTFWLNIRGKALLLQDGHFTFGSTFDWSSEEPVITEESTARLTEQLERVLRVRWQLCDLWAGVRPITADLLPVLGVHPQLPRCWIFNGLGSRGLLIAPFLSHHLLEALDGTHEIASRWNVQRFWKSDPIFGGSSKRT